MSEHSHDDAQTMVPGGKPSQAEGERQDSQAQHNQTEVPAGKPSQAEGDREQIEEELGER